MKYSNEDNEYIKKVAAEAVSMSEAARKLGMNFKTFKKIALKLKCYNPNRGRYGVQRVTLEQKKEKLQEIVER